MKTTHRLASGTVNSRATKQCWHVVAKAELLYQFYKEHDSASLNGYCAVSEVVTKLRSLGTVNCLTAQNRKSPIE
jgi:hypothetical protein